MILVHGYEQDKVYQGNVNTLYLQVKVEVKVKATLIHAMKAQTGAIKVRFYPFFNLGPGRGGRLTPRLGRFNPRERQRYPL